MTTNLEMLPCAFCGSHADAGEVEGHGFVVTCSNDESCARQTMPHPSQSDAIEAWNARKLRPLA
jgi:hypothetical protein